MNEPYCFTKSPLKWAFSAALILTLSLGACAQQPPEPDVSEESLTVEETVGATSGETQQELDPTSADVMYRVFSGEVLGSEGEMERAAYEYLEAAMESDDPAIAARATRIAMAAQAWQHAAMASDRWVVLQPENIDARQTAARTAMVVGDYVSAEHHLDGIIKQMDDSPGRAWALVTGLLTSASNADKAGQILNRLVEDNGAAENPDAIFARSQYTARTGILEEAREMAEQAIALEPGRAEFHAWAGRLAVNLEQEDEALDYYRTAWELRPESRQISMAYAELLKRNDEVDRAQEVLAGLEDTPVTRFARIAFALDSDRGELAEEIYDGYRTAQYPDDMEHAFQAGQAAELLERVKEAADWYEKVERGERALVAALRGAYLSAELGELDSARHQLARMRLQHDSAIVKESYLAESEILVNAGQADESYRLLSSALKAIPDDIQLLYGRAMVAVELSRFGEAEVDLRQVIEQDPQNAAALNALGYTLADRVGRYEEAESLIQAAYSLQPEEASIIDSMGWVAYRLGRLEEAEGFLRDALARDSNAEIAAHLGEVLWAQKRQDDALDVWNSALDTDPENEVLLETMQRLGATP